jgi:Ribonuclease G/E
MRLRASVGAVRSPGQNADRSQPSSSGVFDEFGITAELEKALRPKVWLKSVGYIVINQSEALVVSKLAVKDARGMWSANGV